MTVEQIIAINEERKAELRKPYNPITGEGCDSCERQLFTAIELGMTDYLVPSDCYEEKIFQDLRTCGGSVREYLHRLGLRYTKVNLELVRKEVERARSKHDFEYCAAKYFYIKDKNPDNTKPDSGGAILNP